MEERRINIAVIGCGNKAMRTHLPIISNMKDVNLKYVVDINEERAKLAKEMFGAEEYLTDYRMLNGDSGVQAVIICTHTHLHREIALYCMKLGMDVFTEKPVALNVLEAEEMNECAIKNGRILDVGVCMRFNNVINRIKELIESGVIGRIYHVDVALRNADSLPGFGSDYTDRMKSGGGVLADLGIHIFDTINYCMGNKEWGDISVGCHEKQFDTESYKAVSKGRYYNRAGGTYDVEECVSGSIRSCDGISLNFILTWMQNIPIEDKRIDFLGTKGGIRFNYYGSAEVWQRDECGAIVSISKIAYDGGMYENELKEFISDVKARRVSINNIECVLPAVGLIDNLYARA